MFFCYVTPTKSKKLFHVREEIRNVEIFSYHSKVSEWIDSLKKMKPSHVPSDGSTFSGKESLMQYDFLLIMT